MGSKVTNKNGNVTINRAIAISLGLHFFAMLMMFVIPSDLFMKKDAPLDITWVELPKGTGEDIYSVKASNELPQQTIQEEKKIPIEETKPPEPVKKEVAKVPPPEEKKPSPTAMKDITQKPKPEKVPKITSNKMSSALAKIDKRLENRSVAQPGVPGEGFKYGTADQPVKDMNYHAELLKYRALVKARVLRQWIPPSAAEGVKGTVKISVSISKGGDIISAQFVQRTSNAALNESAMRAVRRASPFPVPPEPLKWEAYSEGFTIAFNP